ncbi:MAG: ABC transporter substrate-binding protein [Jatrophihabitantaceae bacterium]
MLLAVTACSSSGGTSSGASGATVPSASHSPSDAGAGSTGAGSFTLTAPADIKAAGKLKICADIVYPPYTFMQNNRPTGIDVDVANALSEAMGVKVDWLQTGYVGIFAALQGGKCDMIINGINGEADHDNVMAQIPYLQDTQGFITKQGNPANIKTLDDAAGKSIATQLGSTTAAYLQKLSKQLQAKGKSPINIVTLPQDTAAFAALLAGRVDAYFQDGPVLGYYAEKYSDLEVLPLTVNPETVVVGLRKNDTALAEVITQGIRKMYELDLMQQIAKKWGDPPANLLKDMPGPTS